jgi:hypothetical protein
MKKVSNRHFTLGHWPAGRVAADLCPSFFRDSTHQKMEVAMSVIASNEALSKLRQEARRRRLLTEANRLRQHTATPRHTYMTAQRSTYEVTKPQIKMFVSDWYTDELSNRARIIKAHGL